MCGTADEYQSLTLRAPPGYLLGSTVFASYGLPNGACGSFVKGSCHSNSSVAVVNKYCSGKPTCTLFANNTYFGDPCSRDVKRLYVQMMLNVPTASKITFPPFDFMSNNNMFPLFRFSV